MDPFSITASVIATLQLSSRVLGYLNEVKDTSKDRAICAVEAANLYSLLTTLRFRLEEGDSSTPWYTAARNLATENGPLDQFKEALEQLQSKMTGRGNIGQTGNALVWRFKKEEIASIVSRMERLKTLIEVALQMDHLLVPISVFDYILIRSLTQQGTGEWFLSTSKVAQWLRQPKGTLFCPGIPGAGKTIIAATAIEHLLKTVQSNSVGIAYIYCNYKTQEEHSAIDLLAAIPKQLIQSRSSLKEPVERLYVQHAHRGTRPSFDEIFAALRYVLATFCSVYVVIDAVDECRDNDGTRRFFLAKVMDLQAETDLRLMITSRIIPDISNDFELVLTLEIRARDEDVKRFIAGQVYRLPRCIRRDAALQKMVQEEITEAVNGMFLLARLYTDSLLDKRTPKDVKSTVTRLSKGSVTLDDAYREAIQRIEGQLSGDLEQAKKVLSWITYAKRPPTTAELCCALAVEPEDVELDPDNVPDIEDLVSVCAGLVVIDPESAIVRLVHCTTQEYFERIMEQWNPSALLEITSTWLTYLCFDAFKSGSSATDEEFEERLRQNQFLDYAAKHWGEHAITVEDGALRPSAYKYKGYSQDYAKNTTGLHLIARFGLCLTSEKILARQIHEGATALASKDSHGQTPLYLAAKHGYYEMVKLLLNKGADVNSQGGDYGNALEEAALEGHEQIVRLLLDKGADVNAQDKFSGNALIAASLKGHGQIVRLLLDKGADVNARDEFSDNALIAASEKGYEPIVRLLLDKGINIDAQGGPFTNALGAACASGSIGVVKLLLDAGSHLRSLDCRYGSSLHLIAFKGHTDLLRLIYDHNYEAPLLIERHGRTPLHLAARGGHFNAFQYLLRLGIDPAMTDLKGENLLHYASSGGSLEILNAVLDMDRVSRTQSEYWTPIHWACRKGNPHLVEKLIEKGVHSTNVAVSRPAGHWSSISVAIFHGKGEMLKELFEHSMSLLDTGEDTMRVHGKRHEGYWCNCCFHVSA
ncbi:MAG: hypothetical protein Q9157_000908 [Trypethelium eluteriae]